MSLLLLGLVGCWSPSGTGPDSITGHIVDARGDGIEGLSVETVESRWSTDATGAFAVNWKEPAQYLTFQHRGLTWKRRYRPEDDGDDDVVIQLPALVAHRIVCETATPCDAELTWDLGEGLSVRAPVRCDRELASDGLFPPGVPQEATCRENATAPPEPLHTDLVGDALRMTPPLVTLSFRLSTSERGIRPDTCTVVVDGRDAPLTGDGVYTAEAFGHVQAVGYCDGIPSEVRRFIVRDDADVTLTWTSDTPVVDLQPVAPWGRRVTLARVDGLHRGWVVELRTDEAGRHLLPPLIPGAYALGVDMPDQQLKSARVGPGTPPGELIFHTLQTTDAQPERSGFAVLRVTEGIDSGELPVRASGAP